MTDYPLILTLSFDIQKPGFAAHVTLHGTALMTLADGEWWCHGVAPGGLTDRGSEPAHAFAAYRLTMRQVLDSIADEVTTLEAFAAAAESFVADVDRSELERWQSARSALRSGSDVEAAFRELRRITAEVKPTVRVETLQSISAQTDDIALAEAA